MSAIVPTRNVPISSSRARIRAGRVVDISMTRSMGTPSIRNLLIVVGMS